MDLATILGLLTGGGLILFAISENMGQFIDVKSVLIVMGGALGAVCASAPLERIMKFGAIMKNVVFPTKTDVSAVIDQLVRYGGIARRDGILALEGVLEEIKDPFLVKGIQMAVDGSDPEVIQETMSTELDCLAQRHKDGKSLVQGVATYAPAFGMIGTIVGLILMLANLDDPDTIGPSMAIALITTLYGAVVANLFAMPLSDKLDARNKEEVMAKEIIIQGVMAIQSGDNPKIVEQKLKIFLPPELREA